MGCSSPTPFAFRSNPVRSDQYSSNIIALKLNDQASSYKIEWMFAGSEWYCRVVTQYLLREKTSLLLKVRTGEGENSYILTARKGGDIFRMNENDTHRLIQQLHSEGDAEFIIGSTSKKIECSEFQALSKKAVKKHAPLIEL